MFPPRYVADRVSQTSSVTEGSCSKVYPHGDWLPYQLYCMWVDDTVMAGAWFLTIVANWWLPHKRYGEMPLRLYSSAAHHIIIMYPGKVLF